METCGALSRIVRALLKGVQSSFGLISSAFLSGGILNGVSGNAMFAILTVGQLFTGAFRKRGIPLPVLSRSMENSMTLLESMLPWHVTAIYMASTLDVPTYQYIPFMFFNIIGIILFFVFSARDVMKKKY